MEFLSKKHNGSETMVMKKYVLLGDKPIHVGGKLRQPAEDFEAELTKGEELPLITNKYITIVRSK